MQCSGEEGATKGALRADYPTASSCTHCTALHCTALHWPPKEKCCHKSLSPTCIAASLHHHSALWWCSAQCSQCDTVKCCAGDLPPTHSGKIQMLGASTFGALTFAIVSKYKHTDIVTASSCCDALWLLQDFSWINLGKSATLHLCSYSWAIGQTFHFQCLYYFWNHIFLYCRA